MVDTTAHTQWGSKVSSVLAAPGSAWALRALPPIAVVLVQLHTIEVI